MYINAGQYLYEGNIRPPQNPGTRARKLMHLDRSYRVLGQQTTTSASLRRPKAVVHREFAYQSVWLAGARICRRFFP